MNHQLRNSFLVIGITLLIIGCSNQKQDTQTSTNAEENTETTVVYKVPGMENVIIKKDIEYFTDQETSLTVDIYYPPGFEFDSNLPAVLVVFGFSNRVQKKFVDSLLKDTDWYCSWVKLMAASGMIGLMYGTDLPERDLDILLQFIQNRADEFHIDKNRLGIYSCSGNVPTALVACMDEKKKYIRCAAFYYGYMLMTDQENLQEIESFAEKMGFPTPKLNPESKLRNDLPLFIVRVGLENNPYLNNTIDHFISRAANQNLPINFINYPEGRHGFDAYDDNDQSREIIKKTLDFWKFYLFKNK
jgi:hypothetical protein